ncbi:hypothetical protein BJ742DRAFT_778357 [Cladochytrium replicatum]|nr:hypothetical protein BJ742DRAFT_778357 [Cladochytrium replicatum]
MLRKYFREMLNRALLTSGRIILGSYLSRLVRASRNIPKRDISLDLIAAVVRPRGFTPKMKMVSGVMDWSAQNKLAYATFLMQFLMIMERRMVNKANTYIGAVAKGACAAAQASESGFLYCGTRSGMVVVMLVQNVRIGNQITMRS